MSLDQPAVSEMDRDELEHEVRQLRRDVDNLQDWFFELEQAVTGEYDTGVLATDAEHGHAITDRLDALEAGDDTAQVAGDREDMLPVHKMYADVLAGDASQLSQQQRRAAIIFGEFVERAVSDTASKVDASGQLYSITSAKVEEALIDAGEFDDLKQSSYPQVVSRVMRDVASLSKYECDCSEIEDCTHAAVRFRSGRPNKLASPKQMFNAAMEQVYGGHATDDAGAADDASDEVEDSVDETFRQLDAAEVDRR